MIVAADVEVWHLEPKVDTRVVHLALSLGRVLLFSGASDNDELLAEPAGGVAMPRVLHGIVLDELEVIVNLDFVESIESLVVTLIVAASDQEKLLSVRILHALEIVWKTAIVVRLHLDGLHSFVPDVDLVNVLGVLLQEMDGLDCRSQVLEITLVKDGLAYRSARLVASSLRHVLAATHSHRLHLLTIIRTLVSSVAKASLYMGKELVVRIDLLTFVRALEPQVHQDVLEYAILLIERVDLVTHRALVLAIRNVLASRLREATETFFAAELGAAAALEEIGLYHHARGALKVLGKLVEHIFCIEVLLHQRYYGRTTHPTLHFKLLSINSIAHH